MPKRHITCQRNRQTARLICNKCRVARPRGLTSGSTHWLTSWAVGHVAASGLRLSEEQKRTWYGPDTCRLRTPHREVQDPSRGSDLYPRRSWTLPGGPVHICRGPTLSHGGPDSCRHLGVYHLLWPRGSPGAVRMVGSGVVRHATRDSRVDTAPSCCGKGYPCFRVPIVAPGLASGEDTSLQVGPKLD
jgi:hypothetical protein